MKIQLLSWNKHKQEDVYGVYNLTFPSWYEIEQKIRQLDASQFTSVSLFLHDRNDSYPCLSIVGGGGLYSAELDLGNDKGEPTGERLGYINPDLYFSFQDTKIKTFGLGYHNYEIDEAYLCNDLDLILKLAKHFADTATWHPEVACATM